MIGDPGSRRARSVIRRCHVAAVVLAGLALGATVQGNLTLAIASLCLATIAQIFASDVMRVILLLIRDHRR